MRSRKETIRHTVKLTLSPRKHGKSKPIGGEIGAIIKSFTPSRQIEVTRQEFSVKAVQYPWLPYVTCDSVGNDSFVESSILSLDIDNKKNEGYTISKFLSDCKIHDLECGMIYTTFRDETTKDNWENALRYRAVFFLEEIITDFKLFKHTLGSLQRIFKQTDEQYQAHMYCNGGRHLCYYEPNAYISRHKIADLSIHIEDISEYKSSSSITRKTLKQYNLLGIEPRKNTPVHKRLQPKDLEILSDECHLFQKFIEKKEKIYHKQLFGLFLFLKRYQGGLKLFKACISENKKINNRKIDEIIGLGNAYLKYNKEQACKEFLDQDDPARKYFKLSAILAGIKSVAVVVPPKDQISLKEGEDKLSESFSSLLKQKQKVIQFPVGIGKTNEIVKTKYLKHTVLALPNKKLIEEVFIRLSKAGHEPLKLIACDTAILPVENKNYYEKMFALGLGGNATAYLRGLAIDSSKVKSDCSATRNEVSQFLSEYFRTHDEIIKTDKLIITTHAKLLTSKFENHTNIIIDEDITFSMLKTIEVSVKDLSTLAKKVKTECKEAIDYLTNILYEVHSSSENDSFTIPKSIQLSDRTISRIRKIIVKYKDEFKSPIASILNCNAMMVRFDNDQPFSISCCQKMPYKHTDKSTLILSATLNSYISSLILPKASHESVTNIQHSSNKLFQISDKSFSKNQMKKDSYKRHLDFISSVAEDHSIITHFSTGIKNLFPKDKLSSLSIENCEGSDIHKGQKIMVVGTPNLPNYVYLLYARSLGIKFTEEDLKWVMQQITDDRGTYSIMTFKGDNLRRLHFYYLESRIIQAIGRSRSLREESAEVYYFGNFPIPWLKQISFREFKELKNRKSN